MENLRLFVLLAVLLMLLENIRGDVEMDTQRLFVVVNDCKNEEKATDLDFFNLKMNIKPKTRSMKCLTACLLEKLGKIVNNKLDTDGVIKLIEKSPKLSNKLQKSVTELINECGSIMESDRCEYASKVVDCLIAGAAKRGFKSTLNY